LLAPTNLRPRKSGLPFGRGSVAFWRNLDRLKSIELASMLSAELRGRVPVNALVQLDRSGDQQRCDGGFFAPAAHPTPTRYWNGASAKTMLRPAPPWPLRRLTAAKVRSKSRYS